VSKIAGHAARYHAIAHQPVTEAGIRHPQHAFPQNGAMGMHQRKGRIVANRADIAEMICQTLQFRHQRAQPDCPRRRHHIARGLCGLGKGQLIGYGAVAADPAREFCCAHEISATHQRFHALVRVAQPCFETDHSLAIGVKPEMAGFDNAGMYRANRNLMNALAFGRQKGIRLVQAIAG
jgi:hypothetical protein